MACNTLPYRIAALREAHPVAKLGRQSPRLGVWLGKWFGEPKPRFWVGFEAVRSELITKVVDSYPSRVGLDPTVVSPGAIWRFRRPSRSDALTQHLVPGLSCAEAHLAA